MQIFVTPRIFLANLLHVTTVVCIYSKAFGRLKLVTSNSKCSPANVFNYPELHSLKFSSSISRKIPYKNRILRVIFPKVLF